MWPDQYQEDLTFEDIQRIKQLKARRRKIYGFIAIGVVIFAVIIAMIVANLRKNALGPDIDNAAAQVTLREKGLYPPSVTIKQGETVIWSNQSATARRIVSDNYGKSGVFSFRGEKVFNRQEAYYVTFTIPGTYHYHDEADPENFRGTVIVQPSGGSTAGE